MSPLFFLLSILPKNIVSYATGVFVRLTPPKKIADFLNKSFARFFKLDMTEAEYPLSHYKSIEGVFTRRLKSGARKIAESPYAAPCDGVLSLTEKVEEGKETVLQAKGFSYSLSELVFGKNAPKPQNFAPAFASTFYLAPHNYHRVHAPMNALVRSIRHIPGNLWPVNPKFLSLVPRLFAQNERLVFDLETQNGGTLYLVMVGAFNVGRITTPFSKDLVTNNSFTNKTIQTEALNPPRKIEKGEEIGTFLMGSTVVLVFDKKALEGLPSRPKLFSEKKAVKMGEGLL